MKKKTRPDGYTVYEDGMVYNPKGVGLAQRQQAHGYMTVTVNGKSTYVHRLVAEAFIPNPKGKRTVNHKDGDKTHNHHKNLEWATHSENHTHAYASGLNRAGRGATHSQAKLSAEDVDTIRKEYPNRRYGWLKETCRRYGISHSTLYDMVKGKSYSDQPTVAEEAE